MIGGFAERLGREGAGLAGRGEDQLGGAREENAANLVDGLVPHGAENENQPTVFVPLREGGTQPPCAGGIVRYIQHHLGPTLVSRDNLEPPGPARFADALLDR